MNRDDRWRTLLSDLENQYIRLIRKTAASEDFQFWNCYFFRLQPQSEAVKSQLDQLRQLEVDICKIRRQLKDAVPGAVIDAVNEAAKDVASLGVKMSPGDTIHAIRKTLTKLGQLAPQEPTPS